MKIYHIHHSSLIDQHPTVRRQHSSSFRTLQLFNQVLTYIHVYGVSGRLWSLFNWNLELKKWTSAVACAARRASSTDTGTGNLAIGNQLVTIGIGLDLSIFHLYFSIQLFTILHLHRLIANAFKFIVDRNHIISFFYDM